MTRTNMAARINHLEQALDPKPGIRVVCVIRRPSESEEAARLRVCRAAGLNPRDRGIVFGNELDVAL
jgi:hypothetical protein